MYLINNNTECNAENDPFFVSHDFHALRMRIAKVNLTNARHIHYFHYFPQSKLEQQILQ